jgi:iron(III) transport system substrate-binding protein
MTRGPHAAPGFLALLVLALTVGCSPSPMPSASAAASDASGDPWTALKAAAAREGRVVINQTLIPEGRQAFGDAFRNAYGVTLDFQSLTSAEFLARSDREFKAGAVSFDAATGVSNCYVMAERGQIENMKGVLIQPEAIDPAAWKNGSPRLFRASPDASSDFICGSQFGEQVQPQLFVNPELIPPGTITSWNDLLQPAFKGKIAGHDPRGGGGGQGTAISIIYGLGEDYFTRLYLGQEVTLARDYRQVAEWVARGRYPIAVGLSDDIVAQLKEQGLPIERIFPANGPDALTAGSMGISLMKGSPHPNAAKLYVNWLHTREGQNLWEEFTHTPSLRTDTARKNVVEWVVPRPDVAYKLHDGEPEFYFKYRAPIVDRIQDILGR